MNRYDEYHPIANKLLNPDGSVSTFNEVFGATPAVPKSYFFAASDSTVTISTDADNPSFLTGMGMIKTGNGFVLNPVDGKIQNNTNREISMMQGTISFQPEKVDASTTLLYMWGERSLDGITWTANAGSLRSLEIPGSGETFKTSVSIIRDWKNGEYMRFRAYANSAIDFTAPSTISNGVTIAGHSVMWELKEA